MKIKAKPDRCVFLGPTYSLVQSDLQTISSVSTFLYEKEKTLFNTLGFAFYEMAFCVHSFETAKKELLNNPPSSVTKYITEMNEIRADHSKNIIIEFHAIDLSTYFKTFLILSKSVLDKMVPLFSYMFYENLRQFSDKGDRLIKVIDKSKKVSKKKEMILLIKKAKTDWLDSLIFLRDQFAHYSSLPQYRNYWNLWENLRVSNIKNLADFNQLSIEVSGKEIEALEYMLTIKEKLTLFLRDFLTLCEFTPDRKPRTYLNCEECGYEFAKKSGGYPRGEIITIFDDYLHFEIKDREKKYGVIVCQKCGGKTDTDLDFWPLECFSNS